MNQRTECVNFQFKSRSDTSYQDYVKYVVIGKF